MSTIQEHEDQSGDGLESGSGLPAHIEGGVIEGAALQRAYVLSGERPGGSLRFTLENTHTGRHFTYQVEVARGPVKVGEGRRRFVSVLTGADNEGAYTYLGTIFDKGEKKVHWPGGLDSRRGREFFNPGGGRYVWTSHPYYHGKKSKVGRGALSALGFRYLWAYLIEGMDMPESLRFWHEGRCGRCGRTLTDPDSIARGLGPICAGAGP